VGIDQRRKDKDFKSISTYLRGRERRLQGRGRGATVSAKGHGHRSRSVSQGCSRGGI